MKALQVLLLRGVAAVGLVVSLFLVVGCKGTAELNIGTVGNTMAYDKTTLTVQAGQRVHLTLRNMGTTAAMQHNWVLAKPGKEAEVATAGGQAGAANNYLKPNDENVIAYTQISQPETSADVIFVAPAAGTYPYFCTYPGHAATMKGTLTVTP